MEMLRLPAENLDRLVRSTGLILTESLRQQSVTSELDTLHGQIAEMALECARFRKASTIPLWRLAGQPEYASVIRHIGFVEQKIRALGTQARAAHQLQQRSAWNTPAFGRNSYSGTFGVPGWLRRKICLKAFGRWFET